MNKQGKKKVQEAIKLMEKAADIIMELRMEEEDKLDNMPEDIRYSEKGWQMAEELANEAICNLQQAKDLAQYLQQAEELADEAICNLQLAEGLADEAICNLKEI